MKRIKDKGVEVIIHEPILTCSLFCNNKVINNLREFKQKSDVIVANRVTNEINDVDSKVFTSDLFGKD